MSDDLKTAKTALAKLHQDILGANQLSGVAAAAVRMKDILGANPHWQDIFNQATATSRIGESLSAAHPAFVLPGATREICTTGFALETLHLWDERDEEDVGTEIQLVAEAERCIALLQQVDPELPRLYIGARDALNGNNADRARHILSSLRELWNHLLRRLAPDDLGLRMDP